MAFTYDSPFASAKDQVRFMLGDTVEGTLLLQDEEIEWVLQDEGDDVAAAAVRCCEAIIAQLSKETDLSVPGEITIALSKRRLAYRDMLVTLRARQSSNGMLLPYAGGISQSDKATREQDSDRALPAFTRRGDSHPGANTVLRPTPWVDEIEG